ncbi:MAG: hypothetical protein HFE76_06280 [Firmicutes bacterium]|nr:hypothetical protein [Bacillota bacterium]
MELEDAISASVRECIEEGVLAEFLKRNGSEIMSFLYQELSREECEAIREQDGYTRGLADGRRAGRREGAFEALGELVQDGALSLGEAANRLNGKGEAFVRWYREAYSDAGQKRTTR